MIKKYLPVALAIAALTTPNITQAQSQNTQVKQNIETIVNNFEGFDNINQANNEFSHRLLTIAQQIQECQDPQERQRLITLYKGIFQSKELLVDENYSLPTIDTTTGQDTLSLSTLHTGVGQNFLNYKNNLDQYNLVFRNEEGNIQRMPLNQEGQLNEYTSLVQLETGPALIFKQNAPVGEALNLAIQGQKDAVRLAVINQKDASEEYREQLAFVNTLNSQLATENSLLRINLDYATNVLDQAVEALDRSTNYIDVLTNTVDRKSSLLARTRPGLQLMYDQNGKIHASLTATMPNGLVVQGGYSTRSTNNSTNQELAIPLGTNPNSGFESQRDNNYTTNSTENTGRLSIGFRPESKKNPNRLGSVEVGVGVNTTFGNTTTTLDQLTYDLLGDNQINEQQDHIVTSENYFQIAPEINIAKHFGNFAVTLSASTPVYNNGPVTNTGVTGKAGVRYTFGGGNRR